MLAAMQPWEPCHKKVKMRTSEGEEEIEGHF